MNFLRWINSKVNRKYYSTGCIFNAAAYAICQLTDRGHIRVRDYTAGLELVIDELMAGESHAPDPIKRERLWTWPQKNLQKI